MAIYRPEIRLNSAEKELLRLLASLLLSIASNELPNSPGAAPLSDREAAQLLELLEQFVASKKFQEGGFFVEELFGDRQADPRVLREIYLSWRARHGRTRAVATVQWESYLSRVGLAEPELEPKPVWYRNRAARMSFEHFLRMELKLFEHCGLHPRVRALLSNFVVQRRVEVENARAATSALKKRQVRQVPEQLLSTVRRDVVGPEPIPLQKVSAVLTMVIDFSALFTTRDWDVTGTLSSVAAAYPYLHSDS